MCGETFDHFKYKNWESKRDPYHLHKISKFSS